MSRIILDIKNLSIFFRAHNEKNMAVKDVSFSLKKGETLGIVGESGSGKTVTALSILRLLAGQQVHIHAESINLIDENGKVNDLLSLPDKEMRQIRGGRISMIFQEPMTSLNPLTRCGSQVTEVIRAHKKFSTKACQHDSCRISCYRTRSSFI